MSIHFSILKKSKKSRARLGILKTPHGEVETPALVPVATQATIKTLTSEEVLRTGSQLLISNTFHLHLKPGERIVKSHGGLHEFMRWPKPLMTDSGGYQVFSLGFGTDYKIGKMLTAHSKLEIKKGQQPSKIRITEEGVRFRSPVDGSEVFIGPKESIRIQEALGADIILAFDECTPPIADHDYTKRSMERTHRWAAICLKARKSDQALYGIVQGGRFKDLRLESAAYVSSLDFDGFAIGGELGFNETNLFRMLDWVTGALPEGRPRHFLGTGRFEHLRKIFARGVDTIDSIIPTHYARHGVAFTSEGKLDLTKTKFLKDKKPLDKKCACEVCQTHSRGYITHLLKAKEITPLRLLTFHNLYFFNAYLERIREDIRKGAF